MTHIGCRVRTEISKLIDICLCFWYLFMFLISVYVSQFWSKSFTLSHCQKMYSSWTHLATMVTPLQKDPIALFWASASLPALTQCSEIVFVTECVDWGEKQVYVNISLSSLVSISTLSFIYKYEDNQKYLRPYEDPVPVVEDITGMRILKVAFLLFGGDEKRAESGSYCPSSNSFLAPQVL